MQQAELPEKGTKVRVLKVRTRNLSQWIGKEAEITGIDGDNVYVDAGSGEVKKHLTLKPGWFEVLPSASTQDEPVTVRSKQQSNCGTCNVSIEETLKTSGAGGDRQHEQTEDVRSINWVNPSDSRTAVQILGISNELTQTHLTSESPQLPSVTSSESSKPEESLNQQQSHSNERLTITGLSMVIKGVHWVEPQLITLDAGTQCRLQTDSSRVVHYSQLMVGDLWDWELEDAKINLIWDVENQQLLPSDGHHRTEAAILAKKLVLAHIQEGDLDRAIALSCGSNTRVGLPKTKDDNRKTVMMMQELIDKHGEQWILEIINSKLPEDKKFDKLSLRAKEVYTGIPFSTIRDMEKKIKKEKEGDNSNSRIVFTPNEDEAKIIETIMDVEGFSKASEVFRWLLQNYQES
ncbi:hypothetical protein [Iningainema tapete]|uniref:Uncharacterized protein n=2 Tax=Iningainema TaxID=1932705 RepID=A0A8J7C5D6_9CYAN|nr:hypothetical protein [Iningainema tapete BLCC-T55]